MSTQTLQAAFILLLQNAPSKSSLSSFLAPTEKSLTALHHLDSLSLLVTLPVDQIPLPHHLVFISVNLISNFES